MSSDSLRSIRRGRSPFDAMRNITDDGFEYWSAREMAEELRYSRWEDVSQLLRRAKIACRNNGHNVAENFRDAPKVFTHPSGRQQVVSDVQMSRYGCYMFTMSGNSAKPEIAAAKNYFAIATRAAELAVVAPSDIIGPRRPWSARFRETTADHFCYMTSHYPRFFSVVSAAVAHMLMMEEELILHLLPLNPSDLPDGSIGQHWAKYRWTQGLSPSTTRAPLLLPDRGIEAAVLIYPATELGDFLAWLTECYLPVHLPNYYLNKREFRSYGELPSASAADHTCRRLTGEPARLESKVRKRLTNAGGFCPVGKALPSPSERQAGLFGDLD